MTVSNSPPKDGSGVKSYSVSSVNEDGEMHIKFEDKWYISKDDFFKKAMIKGRLLTEAYAELDDFRLES